MAIKYQTPLFGVRKAAAAVAVKGVKFGYEPAPATSELLFLFRAMVNDAIRICLTRRSERDWTSGT